MTLAIFDGKFTMCKILKMVLKFTKTLRFR